MQGTVPPEMQGRVFSLRNSLFWATGPLGLAILGPMAEANVRRAFEINAVVHSKLVKNKEEVEKMAVDDIATPWRLACQMIIRDEDILVEY